MKKRTMLKVAGLVGVAATAGAIAYKSHQTDKKMKGYNKSYKFTGDSIKYEGEFEADSIAANFAGLEIDFTEATLKDGHGKLDLFAELSGVDIIVPEDWHVEASGMNTKSGVNNVFMKDDEERDQVLTVVYDLKFAGLNIRKPGDEEEEEACS
jgi:hypothetical protein